MGQLLCPMCGRNCPESLFNPNSLDYDIYLREVHGLGKGHGFSFGPRESVLGDDVYSPQILERCFSLTQLFIDNDLLSREELMERFGLLTDINKKYVTRTEFYKLIEAIENKYEKEITKLKTKIIKLEIDNSRVNKELEEVINDIKKKDITENVIKKISNAFNAKTVLKDQKIIIEIEEVNLKGIVVFCRELYELDEEIRKEVINRIISYDYRFDIFCKIILREPIIQSFHDRYYKKTHKLYDLVHEKKPSWHAILDSVGYEIEE